MARGDIVPRRRRGLGRWEPEARPFESFGREMEALHRHIDRLFEGLWSEGSGSSPPKLWGRGEIAAELDVTEDDKAFTVKVDLPGLSEKDVEVTLSDRLLTISGEKQEEKETKEKDYYRRERAYGTFRRSIEIPAAVDAAKVEASFDKGVLTVQLPKTKEAQEKVKQIEVKAA